MNIKMYHMVITFIMIVIGIAIIFSIYKVEYNESNNEVMENSIDSELETSEDGSKKTMYKDESFISNVTIECVPENNPIEEHEVYSSSNVDLKNNKVLSTREIMEKIVDHKEREKIDKRFIEEYDKYFSKYDDMRSDYLDYWKDRSVNKYVKDMDSYNVCVYVNENKKFVFVIQIEDISDSQIFKIKYCNIQVETDIDLSKLFSQEEQAKTNIDNLPVLKPKVLDYAISDYITDDIDISDHEEVYFEDVLPQKAWDLYGKYLPAYAVGDAIGGGSAWHSATSTLEDGKFNYDVSNLGKELDKNNSWVEGVKGYGVGERITVYMVDFTEFSSGNSIEGYYEPVEGAKKRTDDEYSGKFQGIYIVNGYAKNEELYKANSRVKKMKLTIDDTEEYILEVEDTMKAQLFDLDYEKTYTKDKFFPIKAEFEILEVYPGEKYEDTAINTLLTGFDYNIYSGGR